MSGQAILIAALSGRALATAAKRAGYLPYVVDGFGDADLAEIAAAHRVVPKALSRGFTAKSLIPLLEDVAEEALIEGHIPMGLVLGAGFEDRPNLVLNVARTQQLLGCTGETIFACKDPGRFFNLLADKGIPHPGTTLERPNAPEGWLSKRIGGSGGRHIRRLAETQAGRRLRYFQKALEGTVVSATALTSPRGAAFAFAQPWCSPTEKEPFRYGGIVGIDDLDADLEARLVDTCRSLIDPLALVGLVSFDFLVAPDGEIFLLEINPRPGAALDIFEDDAGTLFASHVAACTGRDGIGLLQAKWSPKPRAAGYLYADAGPINIALDSWPEWVCDRPATGSTVAAGAPVATVTAEGASAAEAADICRDRLARLGAVLYAEGAT